jgi:Signal peptidase, peptidase S26
MRSLRAAVGGAVLIAVLMALTSPLASHGASSSARSRDVRRGDVVLFSVPRLATLKCGASGQFVQRVVGLPGDVWSEVRGHVFINGRQLESGTYVPPREIGGLSRSLTYHHAAGTRGFRAACIC